MLTIIQESDLANALAQFAIWGGTTGLAQHLTMGKPATPQEAKQRRAAIAAGTVLSGLAGALSTMVPQTPKIHQI